MGDPRRFHHFASLIATAFPDTSLRIADVAAGKGKLKAELYRRGYRRVTAWDRRHKLAKRRPGQHYQLFDHRLAPRDYQLVVGMHPDGATDEIIMYAARHRVPFVVCPCCVIPSATAKSFDGRAGHHSNADYQGWMRHLISVARQSRFAVAEITLPIEGRSRVIIGRPT